MPDGDPLRTELSGFCPRFRMENRFGRNCPDFASDSGWKTGFGQNCPDFAPDSGRKTHFAQNCPDFAPDSGWKTTLGRTVRILPLIPDGKPLLAELSGFCPEFRMENHFGQNCSVITGKTGWNQHGQLFHPVSFVLMSFIYLLFLPGFRVDQYHPEKYDDKQCNQQHVYQ